MRDLLLNKYLNELTNERFKLNQNKNLNKWEYESYSHVNQHQKNKLNNFVQNKNLNECDSETAYLYCRYVNDDPDVRKHITALHDLFYYTIFVNKHDDIINNKIDMEIEKLALEFQNECGFDDLITNN